MKVLIATTSFPRNRKDYGGIFVYHLAEHLIKQGIEVKVVAPSCGILETVDGEFDGLEVHRFRYFFRKWEMLFCRGGGALPMMKKYPLLKLLLPFSLLAYAYSVLKQSKDADIILSEWTISGFVAIPAKILRRKKLIVSLLGSDMMKARSSTFYRMITRLTFKLADKITSVSRRMINEAKEIGASSDKLIFLPYGTLDDFLNISRTMPDKPFRLLYIGNLIPLKNVDVIIKAISMLSEDYELKIVGDGPYRMQLEQLVKSLGVTERVQFTGRVPHEEIKEHLAWAHALILVSSSEGRPNVVLEALASGLPVIVSDIPGNRELVEDGKNGIVVPLSSPERLAEAIKTLFEKKNRWEEFSKRGREFVIREGLTWSETAKKHIKLFKKLLESPV